jgi:teichuronic acid biosynthesis glycosyltransferase TuaC
MNILFIGCDFPNRFYPADGLFNGYLVRALSTCHDVKVICPVPWTSQISGILRGMGIGPRSVVLNERAEVYYPTYWYPPKVLQHLYGGWLWWSVRGTTRRLTKRFRPDLVLAYWAHPDGQIGVRIARQFGVRCGVIVGGSDVLLITSDPARRKRVVQVLQAADAVIAVNQHLREKAIELGVPAAKAHTWHQGVDERFTPGDCIVARRRLGIAEEGPVALWVGRMVAVKGLEVLLKSASIVKETAPHFRLYLVGDGPLRKQFEEESGAAGLRKNIHFVGTQEHHQLVDWYRAADVTVMSSWSEGLPNVLRESLACGTPFVSTRVGGVHEISGDQPDNLVEPGDFRGLAAALLRSFSNPPGLPPHVRSSNWSESAQSLLTIMRQSPQSGIEGVQTERPSKVRQWARGLLARMMSRRRFLVSGLPDTGSVCLTFDDGPDPEHTPALLDVLRTCDVKATFFVVGSKVQTNPAIVRRIMAEGHAIGHHSFYHGPPEFTSARHLVAEAQLTRKVLVDLIGIDARLFRPPHGKLSAHKLLSLLIAGFKVALWNSDPKDFNCGSAEELAHRFTASQLCAGDVVLLHDRVPYTAEALPVLVDAARQRGLSFTTVSEWMR